MQKKVLKSYAKLIVEMGVNLQKGQLLIINASIESADLVRAITEQAYRRKAKDVMINWSDTFCTRQAYLHQNVKNLTNIPLWVQEKYKYIAESDFCLVAITSDDPHGLDGIKQDKLVAYRKAIHPYVRAYREKTAANFNQWCVVSYPSVAWAKCVFPNVPKAKAYKLLEEAILKASRVDNDPLLNWEIHNNNLHRYNAHMNALNLDYLLITSANGTDLKIHLAHNHLWAGGADITTKGIVFNPNMPTEECFSMPHKDLVDGKVVATKPLNYGGKLIEDFEITFKDGKAIDCKAKKNQDVLEDMLKMDEGASRLGEIALVPYDSPISLSGILFYNTLFDENASCHLALGNAYPINMLDGAKLSKEELQANGANVSMIHVDFMFGDKDTNVVGVDKNGKHHQIFKDGNWCI